MGLEITQGKNNERGKAKNTKRYREKLLLIEETEKPISIDVQNDEFKTVYFLQNGYFQLKKSKNYCKIMKNDIYLIYEND